MTGFLGVRTFGTQLLQPDDEATNAINFIWDRIAATPLTNDFLWPRARLSSGAGIGLFTMSLDSARQVWDWRAWVTPGSIAAAGQKCHTISGFTRDQYGTIVGDAQVHLFRTTDDLELDQTTSNATTGAFTLVSLQDGITVYIVAYKTGVPDTTGATSNTLVVSYSG